MLTEHDVRVFDEIRAITSAVDTARWFANSWHRYCVALETELIWGMERIPWHKKQRTNNDG